MATKRIEFDEKCKACNGTGIYQGVAEREGYGVVCHNCNGTGKCHFVHEYEDFEGRQPRNDIHTIVQTNPGIVLGGEKGKFDFGGMPYENWSEGKPFPPKSEMRQFVCPAWWYQSVDYDKKPQWDECIGAGMFSRCKHFGRKDKCWERWDKEFGDAREVV